MRSGSESIAPEFQNDADFFFPAANHTALGNARRFGLDQGDGFIIVLGEVGTGKTILLRMLMSDIR